MMDFGRELACKSLMEKYTHTGQQLKSNIYGNEKLLS